MRFVIVLFAVFLVSCATPKTAPHAYYAGTYAPGTAEISEDGTYVSRAGVFSSDDLKMARMAAFARLYTAADKYGYKYFSIEFEKTKQIIAHQFLVVGQLYKTANYNDGTYPIKIIERILKGQSIPNYTARSQQQFTKNLSSSNHVSEPTVEQSNYDFGDEPMVIMAPEDITGSIKKSADGKNKMIESNIPKIDHNNTGSIKTKSGVVLNDQSPSSLKGIPTGVILKKVTY